MAVLKQKWLEPKWLLDRQREQILAECQAEIKKNEFQANYDRRSFQKLGETIESQQEELPDQQLLRAQFLQQNWELREAQNKSFNEMEELKEFQSSDTVLEITGKMQELQSEINCMTD